MNRRDATEERLAALEASAGRLGAKPPLPPPPQLRLLPPPSALLQSLALMAGATMLGAEPEEK